jgi:uncharacterized protein YjdB
VSATEVNLSQTTASIKVGQELKLTATTTPTKVTPKEVKWKSADTSIVTVKDGVVKGVGAGTAKVAVYVSNYDGTTVAASCKVTVTENVPATKVILNQTTASIKVGEEIKLKATITPDGATPMKVTWKSANTGIVTVTDGVVKGIGVGTAKVAVYVYNEDGNKVAASCTVTVTEPVVPVTGIALNTSSLTMAAGTTEQLTATVKPNTATNQEVTWSSSDPSVATVDSTGKVTALTAGSTTITATTVDGGMIATCTVTVTSNNNTTGNIEDFTEEEFDW